MSGAIAQPLIFAFFALTPLTIYTASRFAIFGLMAFGWVHSITLTPYF
jgi:hypothetical protein